MRSDDNIDSSDNNNKAPTGHTAGKNTGNIGNDDYEHYNNQRTPERWILILAIIILGFGVILLTLRSIIFSLMLITIGVSLFAYWLYVGVRSKEEQNSPLRDYNRDFSFATLGEKEKEEHVCTCPICKHTESKSCMQRRCPCCILTRNKQIIGHFNNPLQ